MDKMSMKMDLKRLKEENLYTAGNDAEPTWFRNTPGLLKYKVNCFWSL